MVEGYLQGETRSIAQQWQAPQQRPTLHLLTQQLPPQCQVQPPILLQQLPQCALSSLDALLPVFARLPVPRTEVAPMAGGHLLAHLTELLEEPGLPRVLRVP